MTRDTLIGYFLTILGTGVVSTVAGWFLARRKTASETNLNEVLADKATVEMALSMAKAMDDKAKSIESQLQTLQAQLRQANAGFAELSRDYVLLLQYVEKLKNALAELDPDHPLLAVQS